MSLAPTVHSPDFLSVIRSAGHVCTKGIKLDPLFLRSYLLINCLLTPVFEDTLYTEMNKVFYQVTVRDRGGKTKEIAANIYQLMTVPCSYTPGIVFEITADLYSLFITVYDVHQFQNGQPSTAKVRNVTMST